MFLNFLFSIVSFQPNKTMSDGMPILTLQTVDDHSAARIGNVQNDNPVFYYTSKHDGQPQFKWVNIGLF